MKGRDSLRLEASSKVDLLPTGINFKRFDEKETTVSNRVVGQLLVPEQVGNILANVFRAELIGGTIEITRKIFDDAQVGSPIWGSKRIWQA